MIYLTFFLAFGIINAVVSWNQGILMLSDKNGWRDAEAWAEGLFFILLWPLQLAYWVSVKIYQGISSVLERMFR